MWFCGYISSRYQLECVFENMSTWSQIRINVCESKQVFALEKKSVFKGLQASSFNGINMQVKSIHPKFYPIPILHGRVVHIMCIADVPLTSMLKSLSA